MVAAKFSWIKPDVYVGAVGRLCSVLNGDVDHRLRRHTVYMPRICPTPLYIAVFNLQSHTDLFAKPYNNKITSSHINIVHNSHRYPLIAAVTVGCTMGTYLSIRNFWTSPGVEWQKDLRTADIKSDVDTYTNMAVTYKNTGLYRNLSKVWWGMVVSFLTFPMLSKTMQTVCVSRVTRTPPHNTQYLSPHMGTKDELYLQDNHGKPTSQYQHH